MPHNKENWEKEFSENMHRFITPSNCTHCDKIGSGCKLAHLNIQELKSFIRQTHTDLIGEIVEVLEGMRYKEISFPSDMSMPERDVRKEKYQYYNQALTDAIAKIKNLRT